jgi:dienelactone hydrolase
VPVALMLASGTGCTGQPQEPAGSASASITPVEYDLGEATVVQQGFDADSRFRNMPVRVNGMIAVPSGGEGPFPVVMVLHGTHPGCPTDEGGVDRWPCDPEVEQANYAGFGYLLAALAAEGYVALAPNLNAENTFGFGEPVPGERLEQLVDLHLGALVEAAAGGAPDFGVAVDGRADPTRLALIGHSRGGEAAVALAGDPEIAAGSAGYGPVAGTLLVAAATTFRDPWTSIGVPVGTILAGCDGDVTDQTGQFFYEGPRLAPDQVQWIASTFLEGASHNGFNTILPPDMVDQSARADCQSPLDADRQREWLADYAGGFLDLLFAADADVVQQARADLGLVVAEPAPDAVLGLPARVALLAPAEDRTALVVPASPDELATNLLGGSVAADNLDVQFCPKGFYTVDMEPGTENCRRTAVTVPGQPALAVLAWQSSGAALRLAIPAGRGDASGASALRMRVAVDPASELNTLGDPQAVTVRLTDRSGTSAAVTTSSDEPAMRYPAGEMRQDESGGAAFFTGIVPFTDLRIPLADFGGVDLADLAEVAILLDQTASGALFLGDVELVAR